MSDIENRKVQDILRDVAAGDYAGDIIAMLRKLRQSLQLIGKFTYTDDFADSLNEIADRIDRQSVVEVTTPAPAKNPFDEIANLYPIGACEVKFVLDSYVASGCYKVPHKPEPDSDQLEPADLEAMTPAIIDVHDCIIDIRIGGSDD